MVLNFWEFVEALIFLTNEFLLLLLLLLYVHFINFHSGMFFIA